MFLRGTVVFIVKFLILYYICKVLIVECLLIVLYIHFPKRLSLFFIYFSETYESSHAFGVFRDVHTYLNIGTLCVIQMCYHLQ
jgi:lipoprotein signal peptidase